MKLLHINDPKKPNGTFRPVLVRDANHEKEVRARIAEQGLKATNGVEVLK